MFVLLQPICFLAKSKNLSFYSSFFPNLDCIPIYSYSFGFLLQFLQTDFLDKLALKPIFEGAANLYVKNTYYYSCYFYKNDNEIISHLATLRAHLRVIPCTLTYSTSFSTAKAAPFKVTSPI